MEHICVICDDDPTSHSCHILDNPSTNIKIVYTCPSRATKYYDTEGTVAHYKNVLEIIGEQDWEYICDCTDFGLKHAMCISTATNIVKLIVEKYYKNLKKISIINSNRFVYVLLKVIIPFLNDELKSQIYIDNIQYICE